MLDVSVICAFRHSALRKKNGSKYVVMKQGILCDEDTCKSGTGLCTESQEVASGQWGRGRSYGGVGRGVRH